MSTKSSVALHVVSSAADKSGITTAPKVRKPRQTKDKVEQLLTQEVDPSTLTTMEQVSVSFSRSTRAGACVGFLLGSWVPSAAFYASHVLLTAGWYKDSASLTNPAVWVLTLCLLFSIPKVYRWASVCFC